MRVRSGCFMDSIIENSHLRAVGSVEMEMCSVIMSSDNAHTHRAILHSINEWRHESSLPHSEHAGDSAMCRRYLTSPVGIECLASLQRKTFILEGTAIF